MKKKILGVVIIAAMAVAASWNFNQSKNEGKISDLTLDNLEAIAKGSRGFPACQKNEGYREYGYIPFCVSGRCQDNTWQRKGSLDTNYCN